MKFLALAFALLAATVAAVPTEIDFAVRATDTGKNVVDTAVSQPDLKVLVLAVKAADLVDTLNGANFTVFAPTDAGFLSTLKLLGYNGTVKATEPNKIFQIYNMLLNKTGLELPAILKYHVLAMPKNSSDLETMKSFAPLEGANLTLEGTTLMDAATNVTDPKLTEVINVFANGSYVHKIDGVLLPANVSTSVTAEILTTVDANLTAESTSPPCFPASSIVHTADGQDITMADLAAGHAIKVSETARFSPVFLFSHKQHQGLQNFVRVTADSGHSITLSPTHYMYANGKLVAGRAVKVGDVIRTVKGAATVKSVEDVKDFGLVAPHTMHGDIVVNGVVASSYTTAVHPRLAHLLLAPVRAIVRMGISKEPLGSTLYDGAPRMAKIVPSGPDMF